MRFFENSTVHNPKLELQNAENSKKVTEFMNQFLLTTDQMIKMKDVFLNEMKLATMKNPSKKSSLLMMNTYITELIDGSETGDFLSLDLGSTNFRVCHLKMCGKEENFDVKYYEIPQHLKMGKADPLFKHIAECVKDFVYNVLHYKEKTNLPLGFTFSFPMINLSLNCGLLTTWTKSYDIEEVVNHNPVDFLQKALDELNVPVKCEIIINDAAGTLMKGIYLNKDCKLGVILGTGFNICYVENDCSRLEKWEEERLSKYQDVKNVFIDIECGAFGDTGCIDFVKNEIDRQVDNASLFPGSFSFEKMFSGKFLGEIVQRTFTTLVKSGVLCKGKMSPKLSNNTVLISSRFVHRIDSEEDTEAAEESLQLFGYQPHDYTNDDLISLKYICKVVTIRCACLVSPLFAAIIDWLNEPNTVIAIDGSVYKNHTVLKKLFRDYTAELTERKKMFDIILAHDGSGKGGALTTAAMLKKK